MGSVKAQRALGDPPAAAVWDTAPELPPPAMPHRRPLRAADRRRPPPPPPPPLIKSPSLSSNRESWISVSTATLDASITSVPSACSIGNISISSSSSNTSSCTTASSSSSSSGGGDSGSGGGGGGGVGPVSSLMSVQPRGDSSRLLWSRPARRPDNPPAVSGGGSGGGAVPSGSSSDRSTPRINGTSSTVTISPPPSRRSSLYDNTTTPSPTQAGESSPTLLPVTPPRPGLALSHFAAAAATTAAGGAARHEASGISLIEKRARSPPPVSLYLSPACSDVSENSNSAPPSPSMVLRRLMSAGSRFSSSGGCGTNGSGGSAALRVEMRMEAHGLLNKDTLSLSDPFAVLYADHFGIGLEELGRTETVYDDLNPRWQTRFVFPYRPARHANVIVELYDRDDPKEDAPLTKHDFLGRAEVDLLNVLDQPGGRLRIKLRRAEGVTKGRGRRGYISVFAEVLLEDHDARGIAGFCPVRRVSLPGILVLNLRTAALVKKGFQQAFGAVDVIQFYEVQRSRREASGITSWTVVYRSEDGQHVDDKGYVAFTPAAFNESAVHNSQPDRSLRFAIYKRNIQRCHERICYAQISASELVARRKGTGSGSSVPLWGQEVDERTPGALHVSRVYRDATYPGALVVDMLVDTVPQSSYISALTPGSRCRKKVIGRGIAGLVRKQVSLH